MGLNRVRLGDLIEQTNEFNASLEFGASDVMGMTITKQIIPTKANVNETDLRKFIIVRPNDFVYNPRTHGKHIGFGFNNTDKSFLISWNNSAFRVKESKRLCVIPEYLFLHFNRDEWDREACYRSWGSSTEVFTWNALCEMEIDLPPLEIQQKYVDVYRAMLANQASYERGLDDLKLTCDAYIENLRKTVPKQPIGDYLRECNEKNVDLSVTLAQGIDINMQFIPAKREAFDKEGTRIVRNGQFAFNKVIKCNGTKFPIALRKGEDCIISGSYQVFEIIDTRKLLPDYLMLWLSRSETHRYCGFLAWGSTRDVFPFSELCKLEFPVPSVEIQQSIVKMYEVYEVRKKLTKKLVELIKEICPILIKGSIEETQKKGALNGLLF